MRLCGRGSYAMRDLVESVVVLSVSVAIVIVHWDVEQTVDRIVSGEVVGWCIPSSQWLYQNCRPQVTCEAFVQCFSP
jgi:hypothetical protein